MTPERPTAQATPYLDQLRVEVAGLAATVRACQPDAALHTAARDRSVVATLQLDGSPIEAVPDHLDVVVEAAPDDASLPHQRGPASWYESFELLDDAPDETVLRLEAAGVVAALAADDLAAALTHDPRGALAELHRRLTRGLVGADRAGEPRVTEQAVQDASVGRVLYYTAHPQTLGDELDRLAGWLRAVDDVDPLDVAGLLHLELLRIHPFEAANGRLARAAARLWLRQHGLDPHGLTVVEPELASDRLGYHKEVAGTLRRRDAGMWLERWAEAVAAGLRWSATQAGLLEGRPSDAVAAFVRAQGAGAAFTLAELRDAVDVSTAAAQAEVGQLLDASQVRRVPGSRGLRFVVR